MSEFTLNRVEFHPATGGSRRHSSIGQPARSSSSMNGTPVIRLNRGVNTTGSKQQRRQQQQQEQQRLQHPKQQQHASQETGGGGGGGGGGDDDDRTLLVEPPRPVCPATAVTPLLRWAEVRGACAGLRNLGNTCFANATLQCLSGTAPLVQLLAQLDHGRLQHGAGGAHAQCQVRGFCALCALTRLNRRLATAGGKTVQPDEILRSLRAIGRQFRVGRQEDAHEFLRCVVDSLQRASLDPLHGGPAAAVLRAARGKPSPQLARSTPIHRVFGGVLRSQVSCTQCAFRSNTYEPFLDLSLEVVSGGAVPEKMSATKRSDGGGASWRMRQMLKQSRQQQPPKHHRRHQRAAAGSVIDALRHFTASESLDGQNKYACPRCRRKTPATKAFAVEQAPNVLSIQLKRFRYGAGQGERKIDAHVPFPLELDLTPFCVHGNEPALYELYAVLVHDGSSTRSGHYFSYVKAANDSWHLMNDHHVSMASQDKVLAQNAYILFYTKVPPPEEPSQQSSSVSDSVDRQSASSSSENSPDASSTSSSSSSHSGSSSESDPPLATIAPETEQRVVREPMDSHRPGDDEDDFEQEIVLGARLPAFVSPSARVSLMTSMMRNRSYWQRYAHVMHPSFGRRKRKRKSGSDGGGGVPTARDAATPPSSSSATSDSSSSSSSSSSRSSSRQRHRRHKTAAASSAPVALVHGAPINSNGTVAISTSTGTPLTARRGLGAKRELARLGRAPLGAAGPVLPWHQEQRPNQPATPQLATHLAQEHAQAGKQLQAQFAPDEWDTEMDAGRLKKPGRRKIDAVFHETTEDYNPFEKGGRERAVQAAKLAVVPTSSGKRSTRGGRGRGRGRDGGRGRGRGGRGRGRGGRGGRGYRKF